MRISDLEFRRVLFRSETKAIACGLVLGGVILEVRPTVGGKRVALVHFGFRPNGVVSFGFFTAILRMEDARHGWLVIGKMDLIKREVRLLTRAANQNEMAMPRYKVCSSTEERQRGRGWDSRCKS